MRVSEYKRIDTEIIETAVIVDDYSESGEIIGQHEEIVKIEKPVMGMVYREMTPEEEAEALKAQAEAEELESNRELTAEERLAVVEDAFAELCEVIFNG